MVNVVRQTPGHSVVCISERLRLSSGHHAYGSVARPLGLQVKVGVVPKYTSSPFSTSSAVPRTSISREHVLKNILLQLLGVVLVVRRI